MTSFRVEDICEFYPPRFAPLGAATESQSQAAAALLLHRDLPANRSVPFVLDIRQYRECSAIHSNEWKAAGKRRIDLRTRAAPPRYSEQHGSDLGWASGYLRPLR